MLNGKTALITGAAGGIGQAIVEVFLENHCDVWIHARKETDTLLLMLEMYKRKYQNNVYPVYFDLTNLGDIKKGIDYIRGEKIPFNILVNNAGMSHGSLLQTSSIESLKKVFDVNYFAPLEIIKLSSNMLGKHKNGSIINVSSILGIDASLGNCGYGASKASLILATKVLAQELAPRKIRVNAVAPGTVDVGMINFFKNQEAVLNSHIEHSALKRMANPRELAEVVAFLASEKASYLNGQVIRVDGGIA